MSTVTIAPAKRLMGTQEYFFARKGAELELLKDRGYEIINLGIGNPDMSPPELLLKELMVYSNEPGTHGYQPSKGVCHFRNSISAWYKNFYNVELDPGSEILPLMGSKEGIMDISMALLSEGDAVLVPNPGYPVYAIAARVAGAEAVEYDLCYENGYEPNFDDISKDLLKRVKIMWINYPHMPTGAGCSMELYERLADFAKEHNIIICSDNAYGLILTSKPCSLLNVEGASQFAVELNSMSKSYNMAGWRVGMLVGNNHIINQVSRFRTNMESGMPLPLQMAASAVLNMDRGWIDTLNSHYKVRRGLAMKLAEELGCIVNGSQSGLFVWCEIPKNIPDADTYSALILDRTGIFITPGSVFGTNGRHYLRISLCANVETFARAIYKVKLWRSQL